MRIRNSLVIAGLALLSIGGAEAGNAFVDLVLYRPSTGQFFIRSGVNGSVAVIAFGAPGDRGLLCRLNSNSVNGGENLLLFRNGVWFLNTLADGATVDVSFPYGAPTDQPLCGSYGISAFGQVGLFRNGVWFINSTTPTFSFGAAGDVAVHLGAKNLGNLTDRRNMVYGVYRAGIWFIDENGSGTPSRTINFGGLMQDVPLLIPHWNGNGSYSLAIYRDGTWFIRPDASSASIVTVQFGAIGDIPLVRGAH
jgi:hypothetical protein